MWKDTEDLEDVLIRNGFRRCSIAACNCGSWHYHGGYRQRFEEFVEVLTDAGHPPTNENGNTALLALKELVAERDALLQLRID